MENIYGDLNEFQFKAKIEEMFLHCMINGMLENIEATGCKPEYFSGSKRRLMFEFLWKLNESGVRLQDVSSKSLMHLLIDEELWGIITMPDLVRWVGEESKPLVANPRQMAETLRQLTEAGV